MQFSVMYTGDAVRGIVNSYPVWFYTFTASPVRGLPLDEGSDSAKIPFVPEKICLFRAFTPELDGERQRVDRLLVSSDERAAKVYPFQVVSF